MHDILTQVATQLGAILSSDDAPEDNSPPLYINLHDIHIIK